MSINYTKQKKIVIATLIFAIISAGLTVGWNFNFINSLIQRGSFAIADSVISTGYGCGIYGQTAPTYGGECQTSSSSSTQPIVASSSVIFSSNTPSSIVSSINSTAAASSLVASSAITVASSSSVLVASSIAFSSNVTLSSTVASTNSSAVTNTPSSSSSTLAATSVSSSTATSTLSALSTNTISVSSSSSISSSSISNYSSIPTPSTILNLKVLLSGAYDSNTGLMKTNLRSNNLIPSTQPYSTFPASSPNYYGGGETVAGGQSAIPNDAVDWVLLEIKGGLNSNSVYKKAFMIDNTGKLFDPTNIDQLSMGGRSGIIMPSTFVPGIYNINIRHRNHVAISNDIPLTFTTGTNNINFTTNANVKSGNQTTITRTVNNITTTVFGMIKGNSNGDNTISAIDRNFTRLAPESNPVYDNSDLNMDSFVSSIDRNIVRLAGEVTEDIR